MKRALIKSVNLLGDGLYVGPVARRWYELYGAEYDEIHLLTIKTYVTPIYSGMGVPWTVVFEEEGEYDTRLDFDVSKAFQISDKKKCHLVNSYAELAGVPQDGLIARPNYQPPEIEVAEENKGLVMVSMYSMSCASRETPPRPPNKMLPWAKWLPLLSTLRQAYPENRIVMLGAKEDRLPDEWNEKFGFTEENYLTGVPVPELANIMKYGKMIVTVDNGMGHMAATMGLREFLLVPACLALHYIVPWGHPGLRLVHIDPAMVSPAQVNYHLKSAIDDWEAEDGVGIEN